MEYHITVVIGNQHKRIASFEHEPDRSICLSAFIEAYPDAEFATEDD